jgi:hypothetical protein
VDFTIATGAEDAMVSDFQMRVSDAEREAAATELREHYAAGRLTLEELNERVDKAFAAKTRADLNAVMTDLPSARWGGGGAAAGAGSARSSGTGGPFGSSGPFGPNGPFGPDGPFGPTGPFGPGGPYGSRRAGSGAGAGWHAGHGRCGGPLGRGAGSAIGAFISGFILVSVLFLFGILGLFGIGAAPPFALVLILAGLAVLRRLLFRRRVQAGRGPSRRRW